MRNPVMIAEEQCPFHLSLLAHSRHRFTSQVVFRVWQRKARPYVKMEVFGAVFHLFCRCALRMEDRMGKVFPSAHR